MRLPTTRLANWTGMRRWPCSTNTMPTSSAIATTVRMISGSVPFSAWTRAPWAGRVDTTEAKISNDMPLPMPRWVISSPIHISNAVPLVRVRTTTKTVQALNLGSRSTPPTRVPWLNRKANEVDCTTAIIIVK